MSEATVYDYSTPVQRVLLQPKQMAGIGLMPAMLILVLTIILMAMVTPWCVIMGVVLYVLARRLCKNDPFMLSILFDRILQPNLWRAT